jgi:hypothetical protein
MKPLGRRAHGVVDYSAGLAQLVLAATLPASRAGRGFLGVSAAATGLLAVLTDYELGRLRVVPMRVHLALDGVFVAAFLAAAAREHERATQAACAALACVGGAAATLTDPARP